MLNHQYLDYSPQNSKNISNNQKDENIKYQNSSLLKSGEKIIK